jgi:hypothetical protein
MNFHVGMATIHSILVLTFSYDKNTSSTHQDNNAPNVQLTNI